jgi:preprotein translocase subunit SecE
MAEATTTKEKGRFKQWWKGLKSEFKKIVWPDKESVAKQTAAVIVITIILGVIISLLDTGLKYLVDLIL